MGDLGNLSEMEKKTVAPGWHLVEERREDIVMLDGEVYKDYVKGIARDSDGFTLTLEGGNFIDEFEIFKVRSGSDEFDFWVDRRLKPEISSTYIVEISSAKVPREVVFKHAKSIEAALLAFPPTHRVKIKEVKFDISEGLSKQHLVNAEEIQT